jgi:hypothetical protein
VAQPDPNVEVLPKSYEAKASGTVARQKRRMSTLDFRYWRRLVNAYQEADGDRGGPVGQCATYSIRAAKKEKLEEERRDREY